MTLISVVVEGIAEAIRSARDPVEVVREKLLAHPQIDASQLEAAILLAQGVAPEVLR